VLRDLAEIQRLGVPELRERWRELFGTEPPAYRQDRMVARLAYRIQELAYGGLSGWATARLDQIADDVDGSRRPEGGLAHMKRQRQDGQLTPGTRFVREWQGERHEVTVTESGFEYRGRNFRSLSAIARTMTGTQWNGPAFFGLRGGSRG
jgi:hypothetical protein